MLADLGGSIVDLLDAHRADVNVVLARSLRWMTARALEQYRARSTSTRGRLHRRARQGAGAAGADGGVLAEPLPARVALSARAGRRVAGHQPAAVGAGGAAGAGVGRGRRRRPRGAGAAVDLRRRRSQAVDLRLSRRRRRRARRRRPGSSAGCGRDASRAARSSGASAPCRRCSSSSTTSATRSPRRRSAPTRSATATSIASRSAEADGRARPVGLVAAADTAGCARAVAAEIVAAAAHRRDRARPPDRRAAGDRARRRRHPVPVARQPSRVRARARAGRRAVLRLQGPRVLRRRRSEGRDGAAAVPGRARLRPARRRVPALAVRAAVRPGAEAAGAATSPRRSAPPSRRP